jgi:hypothetical protein
MSIAKLVFRQLSRAVVIILCFTVLPSLAAVTVTYEYDALNQLRTVSYQSGSFTESYTVDATANRLTLSASDSAPPSSTVNADPIPQVSGAATMSGTASDVGIGVNKVEISTDAQQTWHQASTSTGWANWTYSWQTPLGKRTVYVRVTDSMGNENYAQYSQIVTCSSPVRIAGTNPRSGPYASLQSAYSVAETGDIIQAAGTYLIENLTANRAVNVSLEGGYDCNYTSNTGTTTSLKGVLQTTSGGGTLTIKNFILENQ